MNDQTAISTELALPQAASLAVLFKTENGINPLLDELEAKARAEANGLTVATEKGRDLFDVLSATQTSRIQAAIAALPPEGKRTVLKFFIGMVEPEDRPLLDRLKLTDAVK